MRHRTWTRRPPQQLQQRRRRLLPVPVPRRRLQTQQWPVQDVIGCPDVFVVRTVAEAEHAVHVLRTAGAGVAHAWDTEVAGEKRPFCPSLTFRTKERNPMIWQDRLGTDARKKLLKEGASHADIDVSKQSPVGNGTLLCMSCYAGPVRKRLPFLRHLYKNDDDFTKTGSGHNTPVMLDVLTFEISARFRRTLTSAPAKRKANAGCGWTAGGKRVARRPPSQQRPWRAAMSTTLAPPCCARSGIIFHSLRCGRRLRWGRVLKRTRFKHDHFTKTGSGQTQRTR
jgi:hypothetical protein